MDNLVSQITNLAKKQQQQNIFSVFYSKKRTKKEKWGIFAALHTNIQ
jgi:hypothetical protein